MKKLILFLVISLFFPQITHSAIQFDGDDDRVVANSGVDVDLTGNTGTIACYAKINTATWTNWAVLINEPYDSDSTWDAPFHNWSLIRGSNTSQCYMNANDGTTNDNAFSDTGCYVNGVWHWYIASRSGTTATFYRDTTQITTSSNFSGSHNWGDRDNRWNIGQRHLHDSLTGENFGGEIGACAVWDKVLTSSERSQLVNADLVDIALQIAPSELLLYVELDTVPDGNSADGESFFNKVDQTLATGDDGADNDTLTSVAETNRSYP